MATRRKLLASAAAVVAGCALLLAGAGLFFRSFDDVGSGSPLRFFVDSEIRNVPLPDAASTLAMADLFKTGEGGEA